jgi:hypothetical protein
MTDYLQGLYGRFGCPHPPIDPPEYEKNYVDKETAVNHILDKIDVDTACEDWRKEVIAAVLNKIGGEEYLRSMLDDIHAEIYQTLIDDSVSNINDELLNYCDGEWEVEE